MGLVDRFETDQKVLTAAAACAATPTGPATALARPGTSQTELIRVLYVVFYKLHLLLLLYYVKYRNLVKLSLT